LTGRLLQPGFHTLYDFHGVCNPIFGPDFRAQFGGALAHAWVRDGFLDGRGQPVSVQL
jgi:hypothetical protein